MAELQPVAFSPFPRIRSTASFSSSCDGDSVRSHLKLYLYHSRVEGETFESNWRSRMNSENPISAFSKASTQIWRKTAQLADSKGTWLSLVEHSLGVRGVGSSNLPVPTKTSTQLSAVSQNRSFAKRPETSLVGSCFALSTSPLKAET